MKAVMDELFDIEKVGRWILAFHRPTFILLLDSPFLLSLRHDIERVHVHLSPTTSSTYSLPPDVEIPSTNCRWNRK